MVSGPRAAFDAVEPVMTLLGRVFHVGEQPGLGQTLKLANNLMSQAAIAITAEALPLAAGASVPACAAESCFAAGVACAAGAAGVAGRAGC